MGKEKHENKYLCRLKYKFPIKPSKFDGLNTKMQKYNPNI